MPEGLQFRLFATCSPTNLSKASVRDLADITYPQTTI